MSSSADERGKKEEEAEMMETDDGTSLSLLSASKRPKTLYSDKRDSREEEVNVKKRIGNTWREEPPPAAIVTSTEKDLREKLKSKRKMKELQQRLGHQRLVTMDMS